MSETIRTIHRAEDGNERERESYINGRIYVSRSIRVVWLVRDERYDIIDEFPRLKDARAAYPEAVLKK